MKCSKCVEEGKRSIVTEGCSCSFPEHISNQWDEDGKLVIKEQTRIQSTIDYSCSNGHNWIETD